MLKKELKEIHGEMYKDIQDNLVELVFVYGNMLLREQMKLSNHMVKSHELTGILNVKKNTSGL